MAKIRCQETPTPVASEGRLFPRLYPPARLRRKFWWDAVIKENRLLVGWVRCGEKRSAGGGGGGEGGREITHILINP